MKSVLVWFKENFIVPLLFFIGAGVWSNFVQNGDSIRENTVELKLRTYHMEKSNKNDSEHEQLIERLVNTTDLLTKYYIAHSVDIGNLQANQKSIIREMAELKLELRNENKQ